MPVIYPQLDGIKINEDRTLPLAVIQAIRRAYDYIAQSTNTSTTEAVVIQDLHGNRTILHPATTVSLGSFYIETDRNEALYICQTVKESNTWVLVVGVMRGLLAARPSDLGANDVGFLYTATNALDYRWSGTAWTTLDEVRGGLTLTSANKVPKVTATGILGPSVITDTGTQVDIAIPGTTDALTMSVKQGALSLLETGSTTRFPFIEWRNNAAVRGAYMGWGGATVLDLTLENSRNFVISGGNVGFGGNTTPGEVIDATGNANVSGVYKVGGVSGIPITQAVGISVSVITANLQYKDWAGANQTMTVVTGITLNTANQVFVGGIRTA